MTLDGFMAELWAQYRKIYVGGVRTEEPAQGNKIKTEAKDY